MQNDTYVILDTETASLQGGVCELGLLFVNSKLEVLDEFVTLVNPERPIDPKAQEIHGISDADVANSPTLAQVVAEKLPEPIMMIAHNAAFDKRMVKDCVQITESLCSLNTARRYVTGVTNHKLETLQAELFLPPQKSHSALGDVHTVRDLLDYICSNAGIDLKTLWDRNRMPRLLSVWPNGKYEGQSILSAPPSYRNWLLKQDNIDKDLEYTLKQMKGM